MPVSSSMIRLRPSTPSEKFSFHSALIGQRGDELKAALAAMS